MILLGRRPRMETGQQDTFGAAGLIGDYPEPLIGPGPARLDMRHRGPIAERHLGQLPLGQARRLPERRQLRTQRSAHLNKLFWLPPHRPLPLIVLMALSVTVATRWQRCVITNPPIIPPD